MKTEKRKSIIELVIFFGITFGINFVIGIPMYVTHNISTELFTNLLTLLPASGALLAQYYSKREQKKGRWLFLIWTFILLLLVAFAIIKPESLEMIEEYSTNILLIGSIVLLAYLAIGENREHVFENGEMVHKDLLLFVFLSLVRNSMSIFPDVINGNVQGIKDIAFGLITIAEVFVTVVIFYGEEYGWREYLQEKLQKRLGKRTGVVVLGVIWWVWHLPLWMSVGINLWEVLTNLIFVIGCSAFFGYIYMKTHNVWLCAIAHGITNAMALGMAETPFSDFVKTIFGIVLCMYFLKKEYREDVEEI